MTSIFRMQGRGSARTTFAVIAGVVICAGAGSFAQGFASVPSNLDVITNYRHNPSASPSWQSNFASWKNSDRTRIHMFDGKTSESSQETNDSSNVQNDDSTSPPENNPNDDDSEKDGKNVGTWNPLRLAVLKLGLTEPRFTSPLNYEKKDGEYRCANCNAVLFDSTGKYDSGSGWPSFWKSASSNSIDLKKEWDGRVECRCNSCGGHLGHVFGDGPSQNSMLPSEFEDIPESDPKYGPRLPRFCVNGASLSFSPKP